eukprot:5022807-Pleurochrysis_carterae.AAC.1
MAEARQVADDDWLHQQVKGARIVNDRGLLLAAQPQQSVEELEVLVLKQPLGAVLVVVDHAEAKYSKILS